ncbi:Tetratricopeptide TPR_1 repeat-containing protein [Desulfurobacterium thermolithotrophum DSM 11699]|uniref:Tetratricopeptide TPR_1 repeat-containing protein n=1 Tax=Desulfurobacterium thermolithotrophum (strain DSM 11699 / BSA) TaxID=868864 RepID=F0S3T5_DESTD|nr:tetratricopeptide repeat protein [Desulfurobacterium thermolithotrophum]ADY73507.1 Tetratricopeptide TPR_1 repeat-containing protein [Desulfurobacterium thermolithotrophum DSM 11699]
MKLMLNIVTALILSSSLAYSMTYEEIKNSYEKSYMFERQRDYTDAIKALMPIYQSYPNGYTVNLRLGWLYYLLKKYANSEYHYKKALKVIPTSVEAMLGLSLSYMAQERWNDVESLMYQVLKVDYYNYYGNLRLCIALRKQKKFSISETVARKMLSIYPTDVNFLNELAISLYSQGKKSYARSIFKDVLILDPENVVAKTYLRK